MPGVALPCGLGVPRAKRIGEDRRYGLLTIDSHANVDRVVHGAVLMAFADHELSFDVAGVGASAVHDEPTQPAFFDVIKPGEFLELRGEVTRRTTGPVVPRGVVAVRDARAIRDPGAVDGVSATGRLLFRAKTAYLR